LIVVDANILCCYGIPGPKTPLADRLRRQDPHWCVPTLWRAEFRNVLVGQVRRGAMGLDVAMDLVRDTESMLRESEFVADSRTVLRRAVDSGCTAYDCEYVALAEELGVHLVTSDRRILAAFPDLAVTMQAYVGQ
jgi:predicted nucleic acid-binding protein